MWSVRPQLGEPPSKKSPFSHRLPTRTQLIVVYMPLYLPVDYCLFIYCMCMYGCVRTHGGPTQQAQVDWLASHWKRSKWNCTPSWTSAHVQAILSHQDVFAILIIYVVVRCSWISKGHLKDLLTWWNSFCRSKAFRLARQILAWRRQGSVVNDTQYPSKLEWVRRKNPRINYSSKKP